MTELPESFYRERPADLGAVKPRALLAGLIALVSGWMLFGLPGNPVHLVRQPEDLPFYGYGLAQLEISQEGHWVIRRHWYADRMGRYEIDPEGRVTKYRGALRPLVEGVQEIWDDPDDFIMPEGHTLKVTPSRSYYIERQNYRKERGFPPLPDTRSQPSKDQLARNKAIEAKRWEEPYVIVMTYRDQQPEAHLVLQGHTYYEILDSRSFRHPNLWITTDRLKYLHRIKATDVGGKVVIEVQKTVPLQIDSKVDADAKVGLDRSKGELFLLLANGERHWFDPQTLEHLRQEQLPGQWEREYATVGFLRERKGYPPVPPGMGYALTERGYNRLMQVLAVTFIASLIVLALELTRAWRSTSERTTAVTS
jgi:hypothetical protein